MGVMTFNPTEGNPISIIATGNDERDALFAVEKFLTQR